MAMLRWLASGPSRFAAIVGLFGATALLAPTGTSSATPATHNPGYWLEAADGGVFAFEAPFLGSATQRCSSNCFGFGATTSGPGYWIVNYSTADTDLYGYGDASDFEVQTPSLSEGGPLTAVASSATGKGGWILYESSGVVVPFGDAQWFGDGSGIRGCCRTWPPFGSNIPYFAGIASTPDGGGYWLVGIDGGVFAYGDATFYGSMGGKPLNAPISGIARTSDGHGYWLVALDGGIFTFGDAAFHGSMGGKPLNAEMVGIAANPDGTGYWTAAMDGGVFAFGDAPFFGSMGGHPLAHWIDGLAASG